MHASHNLITDAGAKAMLTSVVGPSTLHGVNSVPLWLRLELNHIREPETLLREAEAALREARSSFHNPDVAEDNLICHVKKYHSGVCTPGTCVTLRRTKKCPLIHVTYLMKQKVCSQAAPNPVAQAEYWSLSS